MNQTREEFIKNIKLGVPGDKDGTPLDFNVLQKSVANSFDKRESILVLSPRQSGRTLSIVLNILYDVFVDDCIDTIIVSDTIWQTNSILDRVFSYLIGLNSFMTDKLVKSFRKKVKVKSANYVAKLDKVVRSNKRLVIMEAAHITERYRLDKLVDGWDCLIVETTATSMTKSFNSLFFKTRLMDLNVMNLNIIRYKWDELFDEKWFNLQKKLVPESIFKREILLEWD
jgi:hypothetical protein